MDCTIRQVLRRKGTSVVTVSPMTSVREAASRMAVHRVGSVVVVETGSLRGLLTERNIVERVVLEGRDPTRTPVQDVMSTELLCASPEHSVRRCMALMTRMRCRHVPVVSGRRLVGVVSIGDCVAQLFAEAVADNGQLRDYIMGRYPG